MFCFQEVFTELCYLIDLAPRLVYQFLINDYFRGSFGDVAELRYACSSRGTSLNMHHSTAFEAQVLRSHYYFTGLFCLYFNQKTIETLLLHLSMLQLETLKYQSTLQGQTCEHPQSHLLYQICDSCALWTLIYKTQLVQVEVTKKSCAASFSLQSKQSAPSSLV